MPDPTATVPSLRARVGAYRWLLGLALGVFVLDQVSKAWINATLQVDNPYDNIPIIPGFFQLVHVSNTGAAWSLFANKSQWLAALAVVTLAAIFVFRRHLELNRPTVQVSFGLLCGGIVGNLVDRLQHGHVIDFLLFRFGSYDFPVFNFADTAICIGVGLYLIHSFRTPSPAEAPDPDSVASSEAPADPPPAP